MRFIDNSVVACYFWDHPVL